MNAYILSPIFFCLLYLFCIKNAYSQGSTDPPNIILGSEHENPSILSRNDAGGSWGIWAQDQIYGYWEVEISTSGYYDITCHFRDTLTSAGKMSIRLGKTQVSKEIGANETKSILLEKIWLEKGQGRLEAGFRNYQGWHVSFPFYLEVGSHTTKM